MADACRVSDSPEEMADKITRAVAQARPGIIKAVCKAARRSRHALKPDDRQFMVPFSTIISVTHAAYAEYVLPRSIIRDDEPELLRLRDLFDKVITLRVIGQNNDDVDPDIPLFEDMPDLVHEFMTAEEFDARVANNEAYRRLHRAMQLTDELITECEMYAARSCGRRCGKFGAHKPCPGPCERFYCCDSCLDDHVVLNMCKPKEQAK